MFPELDLNERPTIGSWLQLADPALTEMMAAAGFDWLTIDLEHTSTSIAQAGELIRIGTLAGVPILVRLTGHDPEQIKRVLDAGAQGIIAPMVNSAAEAEQIVEAASYPPQGTRGVGLARAQSYGTGFDEYLNGPARDIVVIAQIEHIDGVKNLESILEVDGIDGFFVGPYDLSGSLGRPGDFEHPDVKSALEVVEEFVTADGPVAGIHVVEPDATKLNEALDRGYRFVAFASEMLIFSHRIAEVSRTLADLR
jgi:2-dehydro-3-deoxyglucarate aldolase